jgi:hypothetical protein
VFFSLAVLLSCTFLTGETWGEWILGFGRSRENGQTRMSKIKGASEQKNLATREQRQIIGEGREEK